MILEGETFNNFGYYPKFLKQRSNKKIIVKCNKCGIIRITTKHDYRELCKSCVQIDKKLSKKTKRKIGKSVKELFKTSKNWPMLGKHHSEKTKQKLRKISLNMSEETKQKISIANSGKNNPMYGKHHSEETKKKIGEAQKGKNAPNWQGGIPFEPYCILFDGEFKERVREYWNRKCILCSKSEKENKRKLCVHHVTYNKDSCCDDSIPLFVTLCTSCHNKTNSKRKDWKNEFKRIIYSRNIDGKCFYTKEEMEEIKKG